MGWEIDLTARRPTWDSILFSSSTPGEPSRRPTPMRTRLPPAEAPAVPPAVTPGRRFPAQQGHVSDMVPMLSAHVEPPSLPKGFKRPPTPAGSPHLPADTGPLAKSPALRAGFHSPAKP